MNTKKNEIDNAHFKDGYEAGRNPDPILNALHDLTGITSENYLKGRSAGNADRLEFGRTDTEHFAIKNSVVAPQKVPSKIVDIGSSSSHGESLDRSKYSGVHFLYVLLYSIYCFAIFRIEMINNSIDGILGIILMITAFPGILIGTTIYAVFGFLISIVLMIIGI